MTGELESADEGFLHGKLLIAMPGMPDPRFDKSVILMCSHSAEGALGVIVNKPIDQLPFRDLLVKMDIPVTEETPRVPVAFGGPVETDRGFVIHTTDRVVAASSMAVTADIAMTPTLDMLRAIAEGRGPRRWLFALGYAGWGPGQIEDEIASNGWIHCEPDIGLIFDSVAGDKWRLAIAKLGAGLSGFSSNAGRA
jgi:putative transcriptional regulator